MNKDSRHNTLLTQLTAINSEFDARERQLVERVTSVEAQLSAAQGALIYEVQRAQALEVLISDTRAAAAEAEADLLRQKAELEASLNEADGARAEELRHKTTELDALKAQKAELEAALSQVGGTQAEELRQKTAEMDALKVQIETLKREFGDETFAYQQRASAERDALLGEMNDQRVKAEAALASLQKISAEKYALAEQQLDAMLSYQKQLAAEKQVLLHEINAQRSAAQRQIDSLRDVASERIDALQQRIYDLNQGYLEREKALALELGVAKQALVDQLKHQIDIERGHAARHLATHVDLTRLQQEKLQLERDYLQERQRLTSELQSVSDAKTRNEKAYDEAISALKAQIDGLTLDGEAASAELMRFRHEAITEKETIAHTHAKEVEGLQAQIADRANAENILRTQLHEELKALSHARETLANAHRTISSIYESSSWRLTAPLRALTLMFLGLKSSEQSARASQASIKSVSSGLHFNDLASPTEVPQTVNINSESSLISDSLPNPSTQESSMSPMIKSQNGKVSTTAANSLEDLLDSYDRTFVRKAYKAILKREPDQSGMAFFLGRLRQGYTKMSILSAIRLSEESRLIRADLPWLDVAVERHRKEVSRYFGWYYRLKNGSEGNSPAERKLRAIENQIMRVGEENNRRFNMLEVSIEHLNGIVSRQVDSMLEIVAAARTTQGLATSSESVKAIDLGKPKSIRVGTVRPSPRATTFSSQLRSAIQRKAW